TIIVLLVLRVLPKLEVGKRTRGLLYVQVQDRPGVLEEIAEQLGRSLVRVQQVIPGEEQRLELLVQVNGSKTVMSLIEKMRRVQGVRAGDWEGRQVCRQGEEASEDD